MLCSNTRPEGFSLKSHLAAPLPTSCFVDVVLIPLPIWIALVLLPVLLLLSLPCRESAFHHPSAHVYGAPQYNCAFKSTSIIYYIMIIADALMAVLELVRLEYLQFGIGLLPFIFVGLLLGAVLHWTEGFNGRIRGWQSINFMIWLGGAIMSVIKLIGLNHIGIHAWHRSKYPIADQVTDMSIMAGLYAVTAFFELVLVLWRVLRRPHSKQMTPNSGISPVVFDSAGF